MNGSDFQENVMQKFLAHRVPAGVAVMLALAVPAALAQVKVFDRPPTLEELRASLAARAPAVAPAPEAPPAATDGTDRVRARGIVWAQPRPATAVAAAAVAAPVVTQAANAASAAAAPPAASAAGSPVALPISFEPGSSRLVGQSHAYIEPIAMLLRLDPSLRMVVEGHTDANGSPSRNLVLSWERALAVLRVLVERHGIDPQRLQPVGRGSLEPIDGAAPEAAVNRRVQFRPLG
jgi:outer membrane protein OmpA-like peptidoglycan-associated protein